ncbi:lasso peptide biosynthesis B2 protein [Streptomyces sp. NPDC047726]|uniref:lasso peptide biosynthesis B2 protein n=1 Tax=unclassified Streptomyces TaxID=2593676 RepID=UPI0033E5A80E
MRQTAIYYAVGPEGGVALLDTRRGRGRWRIFDPISAKLWCATLNGVPVERAVDNLVARLTEQGLVTEARARKDLTSVVADLTRSRLLVPARRTIGRPALPVRFAVAALPSFPVRLASKAGLALALVLLRCTPMRFVHAAARGATWLPGKLATAEDTEEVHAGVRQAGRAWIGRSACLEESLGTFLASALIGRRTRWVLGAAFLPQSAHAWVEADGSIIGQGPEDRVWTYVSVLEVERSN